MAPISQEMQTVDPAGSQSRSPIDPRSSDPRRGSTTRTIRATRAATRTTAAAATGTIAAAAAATGTIAAATAAGAASRANQASPTSREAPAAVAAAYASSNRTRILAAAPTPAPVETTPPETNETKEEIAEDPTEEVVAEAAAGAKLEQAPGYSVLEPSLPASAQTWGTSRGAVWVLSRSYTARLEECGAYSGEYAHF